MSVGSKWNKYGTAGKKLTDEQCEKAYEEFHAKIAVRARTCDLTLRHYVRLWCWCGRTQVLCHAFRMSSH